MSLFKNLFGKDSVEEKPKSFWFYLEETTLDEIEKISFEKPVILFKHSTRCSISRMVWNNFQKEYLFPTEKMEVYYLDLLNYREISNEIANRFNIVHQSPQILVIKNGACVYNASHESINVAQLEQYI